MSRMLPIGTLVTCPKCAAEIAVVKYPLYDGEVFSTNHVTLIQQGHAEKRKMTCNDCGTAFAQMMIHTKEGWK